MPEFNLTEAEEKIQKFWEANNIFEKSLEIRQNAKHFVFFDGPPFATGLPHYGHILASTIKDLIPRFFTMKGYRVDRRWGWDCHGLPIENIIEDNLGVSGRKEIEKYGIAEFNKKAKEQVLRFAGDWKKTIERIGRFVDFENSYKTMDWPYMESVWWAFSRLNEKELIYRDSRISLYCPRCETPLSNFEIAMDNSYKDVKDWSVYVKFQVKSPKTWSLKPETYILAWTTTPWTLPGNVALAVGENIVYALASYENEYFILAKDLIDRVLKNEKRVSIVREFKGKELVGLEYEPLFDIKHFSKENTPNYENAFKVVAADFVSIQEGTGIVHIAPAFGEDDFNLGKKINLPSFLTVDDSGKFFSWVSDFGGEFIFSANDKIIAGLESRSLIYAKESIMHSYPVCYRCETKLLYKQQPAWFVAVSRIKKNMLRANKKIDWHPAHLKDGRFGKGLETAPDWNISRSRFFGTPLPVWECNGCKEVLVIGSLEELERHRYKKPNRYFILRHTEKGDKNSAAPDVISSKLEHDKYGLTDKGVKDANKLGQKLKGKIDLVVSSPFLRTKTTAKIIAGILGLDVKIDERMKELDHGRVCEGQNHLVCLPPEKYPPENFDIKFGPDGESWNDVRKRMFVAVRELEEKYEGKNILMVSHGDPLWLLEGIAKNLTDKELFDLKTGGEEYIKTGELRQIDFKNLPRDEFGNLDLHRPYVDEVLLKCKKCESKMSRIPDVFDCWFESGSMPYGQSHFPFENKKEFENNFPADFVSEYIAQTRGWFYTMHVISTAVFGQPPFKHVVTTGNILAEGGEKLSKSKGNFPDPGLLIDKYGADALRYYLMTSPVMAADNIEFSEKNVEEVHKNYVMILNNILRFRELYENKYSNINLESFTSKSLYGHKLEKIDDWILSRLESTKMHISSQFEKYEVLAGCRAIQPFIDDLSLWYLRRNRDRIRNGGASGETAFTVLSYVLCEFSKLIAPITPFIADDIYRTIGGPKESVHLEDWPKANKKLIDRKLEEEMELVRKIVSLGLAARKEAGIKVRQPLAYMKVSKFQSFKVSEELLDLVKEEVNVKDVEFKDSKEKELRVFLDIEISAALRAEGWVREFVRMIQDARKDAGYKYDQKVSAFWFTENKSLAEAIKKEEKFIKQKTVLKEFQEFRRNPKLAYDIEKEQELEPGRKIWLGLTR